MFIKEKTKTDFCKSCRSIGVGMLSLLVLESIGLSIPKQVWADQPVWDKSKPMSAYTIKTLLDELCKESNANKDLSAILASVYENVNKLPSIYENINILQGNSEKNNAFKDRNGKEALQKNELSSLTHKLYSRYGQQASENLKKDMIKLKEDMIKSGIENALYEVRDTNDPNGLYHQVAKYVGRINIEGQYIGTGMLISWDGMPDDLKGRVVLTCAHNYYGDNMYHGLFGLNSKKVEIGSIDTNIAENPRQLSFLVDLSKDSKDIVAYPPIKPTPKDANHKVIDVEGFYTMNVLSPLVDWWITDLAVCILDKRIDIEGDGYNITDIPAINIPPDKSYCFSVGYGRMPQTIASDSYFEKYIGGGYVKKSTPPFIFNKDILIEGDKERILEGRLTSTSPFKTNMGISGEGDSGGPIVYETPLEDGQKKYTLFAVTVGGRECFINEYIVNWIKDAAIHHVQFNRKFNELRRNTKHVERENDLIKLEATIKKIDDLLSFGVISESKELELNAMKNNVTVRLNQISKSNKSEGGRKLKIFS